MFKKSTIILLIIEALFLIVIFGAIKSCDNRKIDILEQNYKASKDTMEIIKLDNNKLLHEKSMYILSENELISQLNISKSEIKELKQKLQSSIEALANVDTKILIDTIYTTTDSIVYKDKDIIYDFSYKDDWLSLNGKTIFSQSNGSTQLYNINIPTPLRVGITKDYQIFVETENPYLYITNIDGAILDSSNFIKKKSHWTHGVQFGFGIQYGLFNKGFDIGPQIGYSLQYNF